MNATNCQEAPARTGAGVPRWRRRARGLGAALAAALWLGVLPRPALAQVVFTDVPSDHWAGPAIFALADAQLVSGYPDGSFRPDAPVSRAEFAALVVRLVTGGDAPRPPAAGPYADVPPTHWAAGDVAAAASRGWVQFPTPGGSFSPDRPVSRQEAASLLAAAFLGTRSDAAGGAAPTGPRGPWRDAGDVAPWARLSVGAAVAAGIMAGYPDGTLQPGGMLTRAQAAEMLYRAHQQLLVVGDRRFRIVRQLALQATAYGRAEPGIGATTATGTPVRVGEAAVDPGVIPLGSYLWVWGYSTPFLPPAGILVHAEDTGGAVKGQRIDLYMDAPSARAYDDFGVQSVQAYLLAPVG